MTEIIKNRNREQFSFANINLLGVCNACCYFCLGSDIPEQLAGKHHLAIPFQEWKNFDIFLDKCEQEGVKKLYMTGQTSDGLQYRFLPELLHYLQEERNFLVGLRSNGYLALKKMDVVKTFKEEIGYSIHTLDPARNKLIMGRRDIPDWGTIIPASGDNVRISIVLCRYNRDELLPLIKYISKFPNVRYIQIRRISTDTRVEYLQEDVDLYEEEYAKICQSFPKVGNIYGADILDIYGKEVNFWRTVETSVNSLNYFTDGTVSDEYFIVEGYLKQNNEQK